MPTLPPTTGAPLDLYIPAFDYGTNVGDDTWDIVINANWETINSFAQTVVLYNPTLSQTINQPGTTFFNFNKAIAYDGSLRFGTAANGWDSALSRSGAGAFTLDSNAVGNAAATLKLNILNAVTGLQVNSAAPLNHILVGDGTHYVDSAALPAGLVFYQTVQAATVSRTQRAKLNFLARLTAVDDSGNGSTDVDLATTAVTPGSYTAASITVDGYGRITAAASSTLARITNSNGSYIHFPDGTLLQWGHAPSVSGGGTGSWTFPTPFTNASSITILTSVTNGAINIIAQADSVSTTGFTTSIQGMVIVGGSGTNPTGSETMEWMAIGY